MVMVAPAPLYAQAPWPGASVVLCAYALAVGLKVSTTSAPRTVSVCVALGLPISTYWPAGSVTVAEVVPFPFSVTVVALLKKAQ